MAKRMDKESIFGLMEGSTREIILKENVMEKENIYYQMEKNTKVTLPKIKKSGLEFIYGLML